MKREVLHDISHTDLDSTWAVCGVMLPLDTVKYARKKVTCKNCIRIYKAIVRRSRWAINCTIHTRRNKCTQRRG